MDNTQRNKEYNKLVEQFSPKNKLLQNCFRAFWVGGLICTLGQFINNILVSNGISEKDASSWTSISLVFLGVLLTGIGVFDKLGKYAGAGTVVPITGFANAISAPAIEYKKEGHVFGIGAKVFTIAGPVIFFGTLTSIFVGLIYYIIKLMG